VAEQPLIQSKQVALQNASWEIHEQRRNIVDTAHEFLGIVYVWGGTTPKGFDCSGLSYLVYKLNGIELPRVSWLQFHDSSGAQIKKTQLQQGDLVFFETYKKGASHVGIYIGDNQFIHASPSKGVTISDLNEPYFRIRYVGSKTIFSSSS
jgi:cell wall-associated NlpC family hydrolase